MNKISQWYPLLGHLTFPTVFIGLTDEGASSIIAGTASDDLEQRIDRAISSLPGSCVVGIDNVMPTDSSIFQKNRALKTGKAALKMLASSEKCLNALKDERTLIVRPYRRMDKTREFRLFIKDGQLSAMSQRNLERHFRRLEDRREVYWEKAQEFTANILRYIKDDELVVDIYFTSTGEIMIIDFNDWGAPTDTLLFKKWDRDWSEVTGLKLMAPPIKMSGDIKVSF